MAVLEAIEKSVYSLIMEGLQQGLWAFNNQQQGSRLLGKYLEEKNQRLMVMFDKDGNLILDETVGAVMAPRLSGYSPDR